MLKLETENGIINSLCASGTVADITADVLMVVRAVYEHLLDEKKEEFKDSMTSLLPTCFMSAEEAMEFINNNAKEKIKEIKKKHKGKNDGLDDLLEAIEDLRKVIFEAKEAEDEAVS